MAVRFRPLMTADFTAVSRFMTPAHALVFEDAVTPEQVSPHLNLNASGSARRPRRPPAAALFRNTCPLDHQPLPRHIIYLFNCPCNG